MNNIKNVLLMMTGLLGCAVYSQKTNDVMKIEFTSLSRGYSKQVVITKDSLFESSNQGRGAEAKTKREKINSKDWLRLIQSIDDITLSEIPDLKSPTMKRAYDGALHSSISITTSKGETVTHSFDDEAPHEKLQKLMKLISGLK